MKGDRNRLRALEAKARYGEGSEKESAQRLLAKIKANLPAIEEIPKKPTKGVSMNRLMNQYGDALEDSDQPSIITGIAIILIVLFLALLATNLN